jgi:antitoxin component of MazEF toxin-antitoxin module
MPRQKIIAVDDSPSLLLTPELLEKPGVSIGDELDLTVEGRTLIIRPTDETERRARMDGAMKELMKRRRKVYGRLAEGAQ